MFNSLENLEGKINQVTRFLMTHFFNVDKKNLYIASLTPEVYSDIQLVCKLVVRRGFAFQKDFYNLLLVAYYDTKGTDSKVHEQFDELCQYFKNLWPLESSFIEYLISQEEDQIPDESDTDIPNQSLNEFLSIN